MYKCISFPLYSTFHVSLLLNKDSYSSVVFTQWPPHVSQTNFNFIKVGKEYPHNEKNILWEFSDRKDKNLEIVKHLKSPIKYQLKLVWFGLIIKADLKIKNFV